MGITTARYVKKPLYVEAVHITNANFAEVAKWCKGWIRTEHDPLDSASTKKYIKLETHNPINKRQTKAYVGDWLLKTSRGFKIYTDKAFRESFDSVDQSVEAQVQSFVEDSDDLDSCATPRAQIDPGVPQ